MISIDSLRADEMPWAGYARDVAPRLTALAKRAVVYSHAYSISSFTSKSLPALLASRYPSELPRDGGFFSKYRDTPMLCDVLAKGGVPCAAGMAHAYLGKGYAGIDHGFTKWQLVPGITFDYNTDPFVTSDKLTPLAIQLLSDPQIVAAPSGKFFAWFHFMDPHDEYQTHKESTHWGTKLKDLYDEEIVYTDLWIGKLLDFIETQPWSKRTAIVVTSDHGESFGEHYKFKHAQELFETHVRVPLLFVLPGRAPRNIDAPRSAIDLTPTILAMLGQTPAPEMRGTSLLDELDGAPPAPRDVVCDLPADEYNDRRRALVHDGWKLIQYGNDETLGLYHLTVDPEEKTDLQKTEKETLRDMIARLKEASKSIRDLPAIGGIPKH